MTRTALIIGCSLLLAPSVSRAAAEPDAELESGGVSSEVTVGGAKQEHFRVAAGGSLTLRVNGPAALKFFVRIEASTVRTIDAVVEQDGKELVHGAVSGKLAPGALSSHDKPVTEPAEVAVQINEGSHFVKLRWPAEAPGDALVQVKGVRLSTTMKSLELPVLPAVATRQDKQQVLAAKGLTAAPVTASLPATPPNAPPAPVLVGPGATAALEKQSYQPWSLLLLAGAERSGETYTDPTSATRLAFEFGRSFTPETLLLARFDWRSSRQQYVINQPGQGGQSTAKTLNEDRYDAALSFGYDFGSRVLRDGRLTLMPMLGAHYLNLHNDAFPANLIGIDVGARLGFQLAAGVSLHATLDWSYNLGFSQKAFSALGQISQDTQVRAGITLPLVGGYSLDFDYQGDVLAFSYVYRTAHGGAVGLGTTF